MKRELSSDGMGVGIGGDLMDVQRSVCTPPLPTPLETEYRQGSCSLAWLKGRHVLDWEMVLNGCGAGGVKNCCVWEEIHNLCHPSIHELANKIILDKYS